GCCRKFERRGGDVWVGGGGRLLPDAAFARCIVEGELGGEKRLRQFLRGGGLEIETQLLRDGGEGCGQGACLVERLDEGHRDGDAATWRYGGRDGDFGFERVVYGQQQVAPRGGIVEEWREVDDELGARERIVDAARSRQRVERVGVVDEHDTCGADGRRLPSALVLRGRGQHAAFLTDVAEHRVQVVRCDESI